MNHLTPVINASLLIPITVIWQHIVRKTFIFSDSITKPMNMNECNQYFPDWPSIQTTISWSHSMKVEGLCKTKVN